MIKKQQIKRDTSPRASGPAGPQFEAKVATHYALAVLARTEAFGLPGAIVDRLEFQRGEQGHPLDDVIIKGKTRAGEERCLEIQAKRSITFSENDDNFLDVVQGIAKVHKVDPTRVFGVAVERTSQRIEYGVQEALELARATTTVESFLRLLETPGRSNQLMRDFVAAFRKHLADNGIVDDQTLFELLNRFVVLVFDYARPGSIAEHLDRLRSKQLCSRAQGTDPYDALFGIVLRSDAIGGETNRQHLIDALREVGIEITASPNLANARQRIQEMSRFALADINTEVVGQQLLRADRRLEIETRLDDSIEGRGIVEIAGPGGAGKSALLKAVAGIRGSVCRIMVLAPDRTPPGGWSALSNDFNVESSADEFFEDLSCDGGGLICIDGLDRFRDEGQRKTVLDVMRSAVKVTGVTVLFTARSGWEDKAASWLDDEITQALSNRLTVVVEGLNDDEATALGEAAPSLAPLLRADHPARALTRNLFILRRIARTQLGAETVWTEATLAKDWWAAGAHGVELTDGEQRARRRVLVKICEALNAGPGLADVSDQNPNAVASLIADDVLVEIGATDHVKLKHDLYVDWALACYFGEDSGRVVSLDLDEPVPFWLGRGFELSCRLVAESAQDAEWSQYLAKLEQKGAHGDWVGLALLALVRSERAESLLAHFAATLLEQDGERAAILIRRGIAIHGQSAAAVVKAVVPEGAPVPDVLELPDGSVWLRLIEWCLTRFEDLPSKALSASIGLFEKWMVLSLFVRDRITPLLLDCFVDVLVDHIANRDRPLRTPSGSVPKIKYPIGRDDIEAIRLQIATYAQRAPNAIDRYLRAVEESSHAADVFHRILEFPGNIPAASPAAFAAAFRSAVRQDREAYSEHGRRRTGHVFMRLGGPFVLGRCGIGLFIALLAADSKEGIELIRELVREAEDEGAPQSEDSFDMVLAGSQRRVSPTFSYAWSRGQSPSALITAALAGLEHWAHKQLDEGRPLEQVVGEIAGEGPLSGALLLVVVDIVLSHSTLSGGLLIDLISSPEALMIDEERTQHDLVARMTGDAFSLDSYRKSENDQAILKELASRPSRKIGMRSVISQVIFTQSDTVVQSLRSRLSSGVERLGPWSEDTVNWSSSSFVASHALQLTDKDNYERVDTADGSQQGWLFRFPAGQSAWLERTQAKTTAENEFFNRALGLRMAMNDDKPQPQVSVSDAKSILEETKESLPSQRDDGDPNDPWLNRVAAGSYLARFADQQEIEEQKAELAKIFEEALRQDKKKLPNMRYDVMYDPQALAIAGRLYLTVRLEPADGVRDLLSDIALFPECSAAVFASHTNAVKQLGESVIRAAIRVGLQSCIFARAASYEESSDVFTQRESTCGQHRSDRIKAELDWLSGEGDEPSWPHPPPRRSRRARRRIVLPGGKEAKRKASSTPKWPDFYFDDHTAVVWLRVLSNLEDKSAQEAVAQLLRDNRAWLVDVNAAGEDEEDDTDLERTWTRGVIECVARHAKHWPHSEQQSLIFDLLTEFSDEAFIDAGAAFLVQSDLTHIEGDATDTQYLVAIREKLWDRLKETHRWRSHLWSSKSGMEIHLRDLVSAFFCKVSHGFGGHTGYTGGLVDDQLSPFLPILTEIAITASPCPTIALLLLDILEVVEPQSGQSFVTEVALRWALDGDVRFWSELGIGRRVCKIACNTHIESESVAQWIKIADAICAAGVAAGEELKRRLREESE